jgi:DNA-binding NarL/FixJ family response regulator
LVSPGFAIIMESLPRFQELPLSAIAATPPIRVLLVDDAADIRVLLKLVLEFDDDFVVVAEAGNGEEAVQLCEQHQPDLVVLDVAMPVMDGMDALQQLRQVSPRTKVVMYSAYDSGWLAERARGFGAAGYIDKTAGVVDMVGQLRSICQPV